jgi:hypothetical protein
MLRIAQMRIPNGSGLKQAVYVRRHQQYFSLRSCRGRESSSRQNPANPSPPM